MVIVSVLPRSIRFAVIVVSISVLLSFVEFAEIGVQPFETLLPMPSVLADPVRHVAERLRLQPAGPPLRLASLLDESRPLEHLEVLRDSGKAHVEGGGQLCDRRLTEGQAGENRAPGGIGESGEGHAQGIGVHLLSVFPYG